MDQEVLTALWNIAVTYRARTSTGCRDFTCQAASVKLDPCWSIHEVTFSDPSLVTCYCIFSLPWIQTLGKHFILQMWNLGNPGWHFQPRREQNVMLPPNAGAHKNSAATLSVLMLGSFAQEVFCTCRAMLLQSVVFISNLGH